MKNHNALVQICLLLFLTAILVLAGCASAEQKAQMEPNTQPAVNSVLTPVITDDDRKIFEETKVKAEAGDAEAEWKLGNFYFTGKGAVKDGTEAEKWYRKSAEQGYAYAQANLGAIYLDKKDYNESMKWSLKAAEQGNPCGQICVGAMYSKGLGGVKANWVEAAKWMRRAADQGVGDAQGMLGECYQNGEGVPQDYVEAYKWFNLSAAQDNLSVYQGITPKERNSITRFMTPEQIAEGQRRSAAFVPRIETTK
jgi:hypothetical protein